MVQTQNSENIYKSEGNNKITYLYTTNTIDC